MPWGTVTFDEHLEDLGKLESWACCDCIYVYITQYQWYCAMGKEGNSLIQVSHNVFTTTNCRHIELCFGRNHYNRVGINSGLGTRGPEDPQGSSSFWKFVHLTTCTRYFC